MVDEYNRQSSVWCCVAVRRKGRVLLLKRTHTGDTLWGWWGGKKGQDSDDEVLAGASHSPAQPNHQLSLAVPVGVQARSGGPSGASFDLSPRLRMDGWISDAFAMAIRGSFRVLLELLPQSRSRDAHARGCSETVGGRASLQPGHRCRQDPGAAGRCCGYCCSSSFLHMHERNRRRRNSVFAPACQMFYY
jgi:hypothetical protein